MGGVAAKGRERPLKIFFDGGCRPNPGRIEVAVVACGVTHFFDDLGWGTSTDAEWLALRMALQIAQSSGTSDFVLIGDSANVIAQANGRSKCRTQAAQDHLALFTRAPAASHPPRIRWSPRNQNLAGIALARRRSRA